MNYYHRNGNEIIVKEIGMKLLPKVQTLSGSIHLVRYMYYKIISQTKRINLAFLIRYQNSSSNENGNCKRCLHKGRISKHARDTHKGRISKHARDTHRYIV